MARDTRNGERGPEKEAGKDATPAPHRRRRPRVGRWLRHLGRAGGTLLGLVILGLAAAIFLFTQTTYGRGLVASYIEGALTEALEGRVTFGPIVGGNLITRAVVERVEIAELDGRPFVTLDSVYAEYDPTRFLRGDFSFRRMDVGRARLQLVQDGTGEWNFERIFPEEEDGEPADLRLVARDVRLASGRLEIRQPYASDEEGPAREAAIEEALRGETIWRVERTAEGADQLFEVERLRGRFPLLRLLDPGYPLRVEMEEVTGIARAVAQPLEVRRFGGALTIGDSIRVSITDLRLPASQLSGSGWIVPSDPIAYRFELEAEPAGFTDLQWLPLPVPEEGGGPMDIVFRSAGETPILEVRDAEVRVRDSEMRGGFAVALQEVPRFEGLDVTLSPLRLQLVDRLLERPAAVDGYLEGRVSGAGSMASLRLDADVRLRGLEPRSQPPEEASRVRLSGGASLIEPYRLDDFALELEGFESRWLAAVEADPGIGGRVDGTLVLDGRPDGQLSFRTDLTHRRAGVPASRLVGEGSVRMEEPYELDVRGTLDPLALSVLDPFVPDLQLEGLIRGPVQARGTLSDLFARADLRTERGRLELEGRFDLTSPRTRYDAEVVAREVDLRQWSRAAPETDLAVRGRVVGEGTDPETARARFDLEVLPSEVAEARVDTSILRFSVAGGLASVDTFAILTDVGEVRGRGSFGLVEEVGGALVLDVEAADLSAWNRWVVEGRTADGPVDLTEDLFADFPGLQRPGADPAAAGEVPPDTLAGSLSARGAIFGNVHAFSLGGRLQGRDVSYGPWGADSLLATADALGGAVADSFVVNARAWEVALPTRTLDSLALRVERTDSARAAVRLAATADTLVDLVASGEVGWEEDRRSAALATLHMTIGEQLLVLRDSAFVAFGGEEGLTVRDFVLTGPGGARVAAAGSLPRSGAVGFDLEVRNLPFGELLQLVPDPPDLAGRLDATLRVEGTADQPRIAGEMRVDRPGIGAVTYSSLDGSLEYLEREIRGSLVLHGEQEVLARAEGRIRADLSLRTREASLLEDAFDFRVRADSMPLHLLELGLEGLEQIGGHARAEVRVGGSPGDVRLEGDASVRGATAWVPDLGVRFVEGQGRARFSGSTARIDSFTVASAAGGSVLIAGTLELAEIGDPAFDIDVRARRLRAMDRRPMRFLIGGRGHLAGTYRNPELTGRFRISNGEVRQDELMRRQQVLDLTDPDIYALIDTATVAERRLLERIQNPFMQNMQLEVAVDVGPDLWLRSDEMNVEIAGEDLAVRIDRAEQMVTVVGVVRLVRGTYRFTFGPYTQELRITEGTIEFVGLPGLNPNLRIAAEYRTRTQEGPIVVRAIVGGTLRQTELALESDPPLSESDQLCFLAVGSPCLAAVDQRFGERIARESALGILGTQITQALAADLGLDYLTLRTGGAGPGTAAGEEVDGFFAGAFAGTEVEFGRYLGRDIFLTVNQPLGTGQLPGWSIEWRFTDDWTLEARAENRFQRRFGQVVGGTLEMEQTYGLFLFREWSF